MTRVANIISHAEEHCRSRGARLTPKRKQVLSGLVRSNKALSAYELIDICEQEFGEQLPAMSMYRILDFLRKEHLVHRLDLTNKYIACAHITCEHEHEDTQTASQFLICEKCQSVKEVMVDATTMAGFNRSIEQAGYRLAAPKLEINCICKTCAASADESAAIS